MILRKFAWLVLVTGLIIFGVGAFQYVSTIQKERQATSEAHELLAKSRETPIEDREALRHTFKPEAGETVGLLEIDKIEASIPIVEGTDPDELEKGVGHYASTKYPGDNGQILFSGHRDTVFTRLGEVEVGDIISVELPYGTFDYEMVSSKIVDADDRTIIQPQLTEEELVISTCYPFGYIGNAPDRYIIYAKPVSQTEE